MPAFDSKDWESKYYLFLLVDAFHKFCVINNCVIMRLQCMYIPLYLYILYNLYIYIFILYLYSYIYYIYIYLIHQESLHGSSDSRPTKLK